MVDYWSNFHLQQGVSHLSALAVIPANVRMNLASSETRIIVLPDTEECMIVSSFLWKKHRHVTD